MTINESTLKLFNAIQIEDNSFEMKYFNRFIMKGIEHGVLLDPKICPTDELLNEVIDHVGINGTNLNQTFHKSWQKVKESDIETLVAEQIVHYITTYGYESLGQYNNKFVYVPNETLDVREIDLSSFPLLYIKGLTKEQILDKILELGSSGIALSKETLFHIMEIVEYNKYPVDFVKEIKNRELKSLLNDYYNIVPEEPVEYLRYVIKKLTGESLLIKNKYLIERIKQSDRLELNELLKHAPDDLASIFFRYKPLFLAMKNVSDGQNFNHNPMYEPLKHLYNNNNYYNKTFINRLRKKAKKLHKPLPVDYFNSITRLISKGNLDFDYFQERLKTASVFRKTRLAYALNYRLVDPESIVYKIRNGQSWATDFNKCKNKEMMYKALDTVVLSIVENLSKNIKDKKVYLPDNINYSLPSTEKSFVGNVPSGSYISMKDHVVIGIHWFNQNRRRVDLDLSLTGVGSKIGWDGIYRNDKRSILFSGDMTNASRPKGASECFYIDKAVSDEPWTLNVNDYTRSNYDDKLVDFKFYIAQEKHNKLKNNYMVDPNNIVFQTNMDIDSEQKILGLVIRKDDKTRFYFSNFKSGKSITSLNDDVHKHVMNYMVSGNIDNVIGLRNLMDYTGCIFVNSPEEADIDLSVDSLDKTTILNLFKEE